MTLLHDPDHLALRRPLASGPLAPLADSLSRDLDRVLVTPIVVPREKALLSRAGGYCERDGQALAFDPWSPHDHRCPQCGAVYRGPLHDRWWLYPFQLWLAERALHAAVLFALRGDLRHADFSAGVLDQYADRYLEYPNRDNVLGPTRPFFSTYLESIWLLQLCVAADLLEQAGDLRVGARFRDRVVEPSLALIAGYDEGATNRQVWNNAALLAARRLLGHDSGLEPVAFGPSGLLAHLEDGLLSDGTWYEGENYHQFAHRGLWYGLRLAECAGLDIPQHAVQRFDKGFRATFATALPDLTLPARKDSQFATSLRQWRFAEACELGLARTDDPVLPGMLAQLYDGSLSPGDTGRWASSAEAERNHPATRLSRADLGWKSLLFARERLPDGATPGGGSALLAGQGIAVFRRERGRVFAALDYGQSGGGHGHPDRLNLLLATGTTRWLDDLGTASYVDQSLHWYRSTLAHNAPLVDGHSQWRADGTLEAYEELDDGPVGWVRARAYIWPDVVAERSVVVADGYLVDLLRWRAGHQAVVTLPVHCDGALSGDLKPARGKFTAAAGLEDGADFVTTERAHKSRAGARVLITAARPAGGAPLRGFVRCQGPATWFTLTGPGQPPSSTRRFLAIQGERSTVGTICTVWAWSPDVASVEWAADSITVVRTNGTRERHQPDGVGWQVTVQGDGADAQHLTLGHAARGDALDAITTIEEPPPDLAGESWTVTSEEPVPDYNGLALADARALQGWWGDAPPADRARYAVFHLGEPTYRRSEDRWDEAGRPTARVAIGACRKLLVLDIQVTTPSPRFTPADAVNPYDNEPADINGDGVQLYVLGAGTGGAWMLVPEPNGRAGVVRTRPIAGWGDLRLERTLWRRTREGYELRVEVAMRPPLEAGDDVAVDVLVNDIGPNRERRRGQLILSGPDGEFVYLRGDRHDPARLLHFTLSSS